ncbi:Fic family protein [Vibrio marisflavi]|uniref:Fido domain-containing protein n=1 Tax=Vibrio marisflavi CECT 7928 TaxID=634439 RepID=A0ABN8EB69_9VIBR|nr:Fic family protein [Vibrio marisflavi]CAH0542995.1 hypothetical protein VMF7928_04351 [Vibrio marisflavi CECT 7928]
MPKKVLGLEVPPPASKENEFSTLPKDMRALIFQPNSGFDSKGNYLSWDEFKARSSQFKGHKEAAWHALNLYRGLVNIDRLYASLGGSKYLPFMYSPSASMAKIHKIDRLSTLDHLALNERNRQDYLSATLAMEEAITSSQLEGASTTRPVAKEMLSTGREPRDFSEKMIVNNYRLMQLAKEKSSEPMSVDLLMEFNEVATQEVCENGHTAGKFRQEPIEVGDHLTGETIHIAPDVEQLGVLLLDLINFSNKEHEDVEFIHPIVKAIIIHFTVGYIHPFLDGNGRTARALFYWFMLKSGYKNFEYISISSLFKNAPKQYARAFVKTEIDNFDVTHFIDFNLNIIIRALGEFTTYIERKIEEIQKTRLDLHTSPYFNQFKLPHITILKKALEHAGREFTVKECQTEFNVSATAARAYLDKLASLGLLIKYPIKGRLFGYLAPADLRERLKIEKP